MVPDWQLCTNSCLEITRQADRDKLIGTPTILPVHARAGRGRAEAGHTSWGAARFFYFELPHPFFSVCTFFGRENGKSVFQMIATFSLTTPSQRQSLILLERSSTVVGFYRV